VDYASHHREVENVRHELMAALSGLTARRTALAMYSTVTGELVAGDELDADYWYRNLRETVRFEDATKHAMQAGSRFFVEVSPHPVLTAAIRQTASNETIDTVVADTLRRDMGTFEHVVLSACELATSGMKLEWGQLLPSGGQTVSLPTCAFQRERYWLDTGDRHTGEPSGHPLLGGMTSLGDGGVLFGARLTKESASWLADHELFGGRTMVCSGLVEMALAAGERHGVDFLESLKLEGPLTVADAGIEVQLVLDPADESGRRALTLYSREVGTDPWRRLGRGTLSEGLDQAPSTVSAWPPPDATEVDLADLDDRLESAGLSYGDSFHGLQRLWRRGADLYVEAALPEERAAEAQQYVLHPVLLDCVVQPLCIQEGAALAIPVEWAGVAIQSAGASTVRARLSPAQGGGRSVTLYDGSGVSIGHVAEVLTRDASEGRAGARAVGGRGLYRVAWQELSETSERSKRRWVVLAGGERSATPGVPSMSMSEIVEAVEKGEGPEVVLVGCGGGELDGSGAEEATGRVLEVLQGWLKETRLEETPLVVVTERAIGVEAGEGVKDLGHAAVWGLVRTAQTEHPGRFGLVDVEEMSSEAVELALSRGEWQVAVRGGRVYGPRLVECEAVMEGEGTEPGSRRGKDLSRGTVLITGGSGTLASHVARHLVREHGVKQLLLCSRRAADASLVAELEELGAAVTVSRCDVRDREAVRGMLVAIPTRAPLVAVVHTAGVLDDGVIESLTRGRLGEVFGAKVMGAWHLHELTEGQALEAFVLFSSLAGILGSGGQGNYAGANTYLDALSQERRSRGLVGTSVAWGYWAEKSGMTSHLSGADRSRMARGGVGALSLEQGLGLLDAALSGEEAVVAAVQLDRGALARQGEGMPPLFERLVRRSKRRRAAAGDAALQQRVAELSEREGEELLLELVKRTAAAVLGGSSNRVEGERPLKELGLDSLMALELRNRLSVTTGLKLPATLVFDHPTPREMAVRLRSELLGRQQAARRVSARGREEEPIAIVGMSCRFPGEVDTPEKLWELLVAERDATGPFPEERGWQEEELYDADPQARGKTYARTGGFLSEVGMFDAGFWGISPREALAVDPQQRLLLETSWEALEAGGLDPTTLVGSASGVFVGVSNSDYASRLSSVPRDVEGYLATGSAGSVASGRIAYGLGFQGPALTVDTACSSSLVAIHLACQSLKEGGCDLALAGGATVMSSPISFIEFSRQRLLSPDGRCKAFSVQADGAGWGEGVAMIVLERLSDAQRWGHPVLAVIRGSAVNQDGRSQGLTAPNGPAQEQVIRQALASAGLSGREVDAVEAHGTGTTLGDPIEAQALLSTYGQGREGIAPLWLGALKSNIAHAQAAAGVAGVMKMVLSMQHGLLPRSLYCEEPTEQVDWASGEVKLLSEARRWERNGRPRRAGVSSFGISGTNVHVILEEGAAAEEEVEEGAESNERLAYVVSGKSEAGLRGQARRLAEHVREHGEESLRDVASSLTGRSAFEHRAVVVASDRESLLAGLSSVSEGRSGGAVVQGQRQEGKLAVLFSGQGSQRAGMGLELYEADAEFRQSLDEVLAALEGAGQPEAAGEWSLREVLFAGEGSEAGRGLDETVYTQPALFALEVALYRMLERRGVRPDFVMGHSVGEIAAAHVSGVLSLTDAAELVRSRGRLMQGLAERGAMLSVAMGEAELQGLVAQHGGVDIAAVNGPSSCVVSGREAAVSELERELSGRGVSARRLRVSHGFHSELMEPMLEEFARVAEGLRYGRATLPVVSNVSGEVASGEELASGRYWVEHARRAVRFWDGIRALEARGVRSYLEVGPHGVLSSLVEDSWTEAESSSARSVLQRGRSESETALMALGWLHVRGHQVNWREVLPAGRRVKLPTYAFQRERYWLEASLRGDGVGEPSGHPLLGGRMTLAESGGVVFTTRVSGRQPGWLGEHVVFGQVLMPGTGLVEMALAAGERLGLEYLEELTLETALRVPESGTSEIQLWVEAADEEGRRALSVHSRASGSEEWQRHASGVLSRQMPGEPEPLPSWPPEGAVAVSFAELHERAAMAGLDYGETFRALRRIWRRGDQLFAEASLPTARTAEAADYILHPGLWDSALHSRFTELEAAEQVALPFAWSGVSIRAAGASTVRVCIARTDDFNDVSLALYDPTGAPLGQVQSLRTRAVLKEPSAAVPAGTAGLYELAWSEIAAPARAAATRWLMLGDATAAELGPALANVSALRAALDAGEAVPDVALLCCTGGPADANLAHEETARVLDELQSWLNERRVDSTPLVVVTRRAVATRPDEDVLDLPHAAVWGLVRAAATEHPDRFVLLDVDAWSAEGLALALACKEPQLAVRGGTLLVPRLIESHAERRAAPGDAPPRERPFDPEGTVLITGASGTLAGHFARHLVTTHGVKHLLLCSRRGPAAELVEELQSLGATVTVARCDVSDREATRTMLAAIPAPHPLTAVIHAAGVLSDGVLESQTSARIREVFAPKVLGALHLDELTRSSDLAAFVLFSSLAGVLGSGGQANYAAANSFLDALGHHRRAHGHAATSLAWGFWAESSAMTAHLGQADLARMRRVGVGALGLEQGLSLFDAALARPAAQLVPMQLERAVLQLQGEHLPPIFHGLIRRTTRRRAAQGDATLRQRLAELGEAEARQLLLDVVRNAVAAVLGGSSAELESGRPLKDLGLDSLTAIDLRNRLSAATGLRLPSTLLFDYPTSDALTHRLAADLLGREREARRAVAPTTRQADAIAIVGMSCRYPGGVDSPERLWELLVASTDATSSFPIDRGWDLERLYDADPDAHTKTYVTRGGFLHDACLFDPAFFGISPREALAMDPQQRLLLETSWEALEDAGVDPATLLGSPTGVFVGIMYNDYGARLLAVPKDVEGYVGTGSMSSVASGRIAYGLGLQGPAVTVDTACSSSLVALHLACQALKQGECDTALAGGVTVMSTPSVFIEFSRQRGLAPNGRCKSFSDQADGTGWAEGVGMLVLRRLSDAQQRGDTVLAVIRGSAVNQDGRSQGLTAPNGPAQEQVIRQALASAGLKTRDVDVVEGHGTGTTLGDPIEIQALLATYGQERDGVQPVWLGSLKSNIGHAQAAAGVGGVIKMVLAMQHATMPHSLYGEEPTTKVDWSSGDVKLLSEVRPWERAGRPRRAGVSSFGVSGTNAHMILEESPMRSAGSDGGAASSPEVGEHLSSGVPLSFVLSAKTEPGLRAQASRLHALLSRRGDDPLLHVAHSLATTRSAFEQRAVVVAADKASFLAGLSALSEGHPSSSVVHGRARAGKLAVLFGGQGSQRPGVGRELLERDDVFRRALDEVLDALEARRLPPAARNGASGSRSAANAPPDLSLRDVMFAEAGTEAARLLDDTFFTQPVVFALHVALYRMLEDRGVRPALLMGHSIGEFAAAHVAGVLDLSGAAELVMARARLMRELDEPGVMSALAVSEAELLAVVADHQAVDVAAVNGPRSCVVSGRETAVREVESHFAQLGIEARRLRVSHAFHSVLMEPMLLEFGRIAEGLRYGRASLPVVSNVSGEVASGEELASAGYWVAHARRTVRFSDGVRALEAQGVRAYLEVGPHGVLTGLIEDSLTEESAASVGALLHSGRPELEMVQLALGRLHCAGHPVDWGRVLPSGGRRMKLPTYAFQRSRYWLEAGDIRASTGEPTNHPLLGGHLSLADGEGALFSARLTAAQPAWIAEHVVFDRIVMPGTGLVEIALAAGERLGLEHLEELTLETPLLLPVAGAVDIQVSVRVTDDAARSAVTVHSRPSGGDAWARNATGVLSSTPAQPRAGLTEWPPAGAVAMDLHGVYETAASVGLAYGETFQGLRRVWRRGEELFAEIALPERNTSEAEQYIVHPALLDSVLHALAMRADVGDVALPFAWTDVSIRMAGPSSLRARLSPLGEPGSISLTLYSESGEVLGQVGGLRTRPASAAQMGVAQVSDAGLYRVQWVELGPGSPSTPRCALLGEAPFPASWPRYSDVEALAAAMDAEEVRPELVFLACADPSVDASRADEPTAHVLQVLQRWLADPRFEAIPLTVATQRAVSASDVEDVRDLCHAPVWGLVRAAQTEHPGRFALVDVDEWSQHALTVALAHAEPQLAIRGGGARGARLVDAGSARPPGDGETPALRGTVMITGASGTLAGHIARHLVAEHGVRRFLLCSRRGAPQDLVDELQGRGAEVAVACCDVSDRESVTAVVQAIPAESPLGAVIHTAGALDDGVLESQTPERLRNVFAPKVAGAWHLHELTREMDIGAFVLFSSFAGVLGSGGQANYAAANAFLDALAQHRRALGLSGTSLAWGYWAQSSAMTSHLGQADLARMARAGMGPLELDRALQLFDAALARGDGMLAPVQLDRAALAKHADVLPPLFQELVRKRSRRRAVQGDPSALRGRLRELSEADGERLLLELVNSTAASVLGMPTDQLDGDRPLKELGLDSLMAVELRNRLAVASGLRLAATLLFDYPTVRLLARFMREKLDPRPLDADTSGGDAEIRKAVASIPIGLLRKARMLDLLLDLARQTGYAGEIARAGEAIDAMAEADLVEMALQLTETSADR
jgi:acyl transferase domain-containing protein/acyl carrier protein